MKKLLNAGEVGAILGVTDETARRYMRERMTCVMLPGRDLRVEESEVERFAQGLRVAPAAVQGKPTKVKKCKPAPILDLTLFEPDGRIKRRRSS